jgi:aspartate/methionine/tyrosine aminotransferase
VQDTIAICPTQVSQQAAIGALEAGDDWIAKRVEALRESRDLMVKALNRGGVSEVHGGQGAIYLFARLPGTQRAQNHALPADVTVAEKLIMEHGVAVIPGSSCGAEGWIRVCYANLPKDKCTEAAGRLAKGLETVLFPKVG